MNRRGFLAGLLAVGVAPAIIRTPGLLMPVKPGLVVPDVGTITFPALPHVGDTISFGSSVSHEFIVRTAIPSGSWRKFNGLRPVLTVPERIRQQAVQLTVAETKALLYGRPA